MDQVTGPNNSIMEMSTRHSVWSGLLPKQETQTLDYLEEHPEWDGRGIVVGKHANLFFKIH